MRGRILFLVRGINMYKILLFLVSLVVVPFVAYGFIGNPAYSPLYVDESYGGRIIASSTTWTLFGLTTDCDLANTAKLLWDFTTGKFSCGTDQRVVIATSTATSANTSVNKIVTAWCPVGYRAMGGGGEFTAGNVDDLTINMSFPTATTSGWTVEYRESDAIASNWTARTHVVCLQV